MTIYSNTAESGLATGTDVTPTNSATPDAFTTVSPGAGGSIKFSSVQSMHGGLAYEFTPASAVACYAEWQGVAGASTATAKRFYLYLTGYPSTGEAITTIRSSGGGTGVLEMTVGIDGSLGVISDATATVVGATTGKLALNTWYRIEVGLTDPSATTGTLTLKTYLGDSVTEDSTLGLTLSGQNFGTSPLGTYRFGRTSASGTMPKFYMDDISAATGSSTLLGPSSPPAPTPPTAVADNAAVYKINFSGSTPNNGGTLTYSITQTGGTATTPDLVKSGFWTVPQSETEDLTYQVTITESGGGYTTVTVTVPQLTASSGTSGIQVLVASAPGSGNWA